MCDDFNVVLIASIMLIAALLTCLVNIWQTRLLTRLKNEMQAITERNHEH